MANCPECGKYFRLKQQAIDHINNYHADVLDERSMDAPQLLYYSTHGTLHGICQCGCGKETEWNEKTGKPYKLSPDPECRKRAYQKAEENMMKARGQTVHSLLHDMEHQREMQQHRPTYGEYKFSTGGKVEYLSKLELSFLKFCDNIMDFTANMIIPCPFVYDYYDNVTNTKRSYIPDYYLPDYNLIVEIKDKNNTNPAFVKETKYKVAMKDAVMKEQHDHNYIRINGTNYGPFVEILYRIVHDKKSDTSDPNKIIVITESTLQTVGPADPVTRPASGWFLMVDRSKDSARIVTGDQLATLAEQASMESHQLNETQHENALAGDSEDVQVYQYIGDPDIGPFHKVASEFPKINESVRSLLASMALDGIFFDNGTGMKNNNSRKMMFIRIC